MNLEALLINGERRPLTLPFRATVGDAVELRGVAIDDETQRPVANLLLWMDRQRTYAVQTGLPPDNSGFSVTIPTADLRPAHHQMFFAFVLGDGREWGSPPMTLALEPAADAPPAPRQIVIAGAMKTGGRHVRSVLLAYFGITNPTFGIANDGEHLLTYEFIGPAIDRPFVLHMHLAARVVNLNAISYWGFQPMMTWRNLGDVAVSLDDHTLREPDGMWRNTYTYLPERESYARMPEQRRLDFQIRNAIPWYFNFYLSWRFANLPLFTRYELMSLDETAFFRNIIETLAGNVDEERLGAIVKAGPTETSGLNVGRVGRSTTALSEASQTLLETMIREHPSDIRELLFELPWYVSKYGMPQLVATTANDAYLIAENTKFRASDGWLRSHGFTRAQLPVIAAAELDRLPAGAALY